MINVKFFGLLRMDFGVSEVSIEFEKAKNVKELCKFLPTLVDKSTEAELRNSIIFVRDKNITSQKMFRTAIKDGDEILFMASVSGG